MSSPPFYSYMPSQEPPAELHGPSLLDLSGQQLMSPTASPSSSSTSSRSQSSESTPSSRPLSPVHGALSDAAMYPPWLMWPQHPQHPQQQEQQPTILQPNECLCDHTCGCCLYVSHPHKELWRTDRGRQVLRDKAKRGHQRSRNVHPNCTADCPKNYLLPPPNPATHSYQAGHQYL
jgi:hypothetical protein